MYECVQRLYFSKMCFTPSVDQQITLSGYIRELLPVLHQYNRARSLPKDICRLSLHFCWVFSFVQLDQAHFEPFLALSLCWQAGGPWGDCLIKCINHRGWGEGGCDIKRHFLFNGFPVMFSSNPGSFPSHHADFALEQPPPTSLSLISFLGTHIWSPPPPLFLLTSNKENGVFLSIWSMTCLPLSVTYFPDPRSWRWRVISSTGAHSRTSQFPVTRVKRKHMGHLLTKWILEVQINIHLYR